MDCSSQAGSFGYETKLPFLNELVKKVAESRMKSEYRELGMLSPQGFPEQDTIPLRSDLGPGVQEVNHSRPDAGVQGVNLKVPSYKPMRSCQSEPMESVDCDDMPSCSTSSSLPTVPAPTEPLAPIHSANNKINDTLKGIIAKTIAEKVRSRSQGREREAAFPLYCQGREDMNSYRSHAVEQPAFPNRSLPCASVPNKRLKIQQKSSHRSATAGASATCTSTETDPSSSSQETKTTEKKTRPKRGQYRKYNSQLLLEAVRAVQRGEMSVHRAGSYFGVPHSTLEYKVKERHLLRQKKPREARVKKSPVIKEASSSNTDGESTTSSSQTPVPVSDNSTASSSSAASSETTAVIPAASTSPRPDPPTPGHSKPNKTKSHSPVSSHSNIPATMETAMLPGMLPTTGAAAILQAQATAASLSSLSLGGALPLGFGWPPPLLGASFPPLGLPDPLLSAYVPNVGINTSASSLLKKLQQKVQAETTTAGFTSIGREEENVTSPRVPGNGNKQGSQVVVK